MKQKRTAIMLTFFLGGLGFHKFYLEDYIVGALYFIFCWTFIPLLFSIFDFIGLLTTSNNGFDVQYNPTYKKCEDCLENVRREAKVCRHCGFRFDK